MLKVSKLTFYYKIEILFIYKKQNFENFENIAITMNAVGLANFSTTITNVMLFFPVFSFKNNQYAHIFANL